MLARLAVRWLTSREDIMTWPFAILGLLLAGLIFRFGFSRLAVKNVERIMSMKREVCFFAFQEWTSYIIVAVMITMGKVIRQLPIPRHILASVYLGIGGALFIASLTYYQRLMTSLEAKPDG